MRNEMAGRSASCTAQEPIRLFVRNVWLVHEQVEASKLSYSGCERCLFGKWKASVVQSSLWFTGKVVSCFAMSASSEESLKKDDNGGKSDSGGDIIFVKIRSLSGDAICEALQSKFC